jgi:small subunit ribosomal protein S21|tara:strand:+ start:731 stop:976 length:246 start_codon:yes stop_codon:yes gene_type:complete
MAKFDARKGNKVGRTVYVQNEDINRALSKFRKKVMEEGVIQEYKERQHHEKPCDKRNRKKAAAISRNRKRVQKDKDSRGSQ